jgi:tetratricopeptide (TPR) repeat protein
MENMNLQKLVDKAGEMALNNMWGEKAYKVNVAILKMDRNNCAAYTRLAKYYKLNDNTLKAKSMYLKALNIDPNNRGAINNLSDMDKDEKESDAVDQIKSTKELLKEGQSSMLKGRYNLAAKLFSRAYSIEPLLTYAVSVANAYKKMDQYDKIEKLYHQLIEESSVQSEVEAIDNEFNMLRPNEKILTQ